MKIILNKALPVIAVLLLAIPLVLTGCTSKDPVAADVLKIQQPPCQRSAAIRPISI